MVGNNILRVREEYKNSLKLKRNSDRPKLWDDKTAEHVLEAILRVNK